MTKPTVSTHWRKLVGWKAVFSVTVEKCSQSHLLAHLEENSRRLVQRQRTPDGRVLFVDSVVHPADDGLLSAVSDDQRYPKQRHSSMSGTLVPCYADTGRLWWWACTGLDLPHRASKSVHSRCDNPQSCLCVLLTRHAVTAMALSTLYSLSVTDLGASVSTMLQ